MLARVLCRSIGRAAQDFVQVYKTVRDPSPGQSASEFTTIDPLQHMYLRIPRNQAATFGQNTQDDSIYSNHSVYIVIEACQCVTADGCSSYNSSYSNCKQLVC